MTALVMGDRVQVPFQINETDTLAGTSCELVSPVNGFVRSLAVVVSKAVTTGGTVKVSAGTTDVVGASVTVGDAATKGTVIQADATPGSSTQVVTKGQRIQVTPAAAFATAGAVNGWVEFSTSL